ncbi:MAG: hypothetical protein B9S32_09005 [Verrucomicrobia bacterium Tous-C9LFEB]|nr:MAG: hypothetical protein B9S32_09005 [Verrucomicrobia bacterium Tous-C9LFEB]
MIAIMNILPHTNLRSAFALIEVLVVTVCIGVLVALLFPALQKGRSAARDARCLANLRQLATASLSFASDNGGKVPDRARTPDWVSWQIQLSPYLNLSLSQIRTRIACPAAVPQPQPPPKGDDSTYGISVYMANHPDIQRSLFILATPVLLFVDKPTSNTDNWGPWNDRRLADTLSLRQAMFRHGNGTCTQGVFTDGHAETMKPSRAGIFAPLDEGNVWVPRGISYRFSGYFITPSPTIPTDDIR